MPRTLSLGRLAIACLAVAASASAQGQTSVAARIAVTRALPLVQRSIDTFVTRRTCVSCHHHSIAALTLRAAQSHGFAVTGAVLEAVESRTFRALGVPSALDDAIQAVGASDPTPGDAYILMAAHAAVAPSTVVTRVWARRILRWQRDDGHWITSDFRPPHSSSAFTATATAIRALVLDLPPELRRERDVALARARTWFREHAPRSTEDAAFRVMGMAWAGATRADVDQARHDLMALRHPDGGWPQIPGYASDAYSTGEALVALREAGVGRNDAAVQRAVTFLSSTQAPDGSWHVRTRMVSPADVSPPYFHTGFPYGKDEYLSFTGTCWAVMGLVSALPSPILGGMSGTSLEEPAWVRVALFGTPADLAAALDSGVDPNSATPGGTTILMAASWDPAKVRMLLARGAKVGTRAPSGADALAVASQVPRNMESIRLLLDAGAAAEPPDDVKIRRTPLVLASRSGDVEMVRLLLERGSRPSTEAVAEAVTFGYADVTRALVQAGVNVSFAESSGVNLLHWAVITNRASVVPVLVEAGVPIDDVDGFDYTPLMYAVTLDQGETDTLEAVLRARPNRAVRNDKGRTALQQARRLGRARAVRLLTRQTETSAARHPFAMPTSR